MTQRKQHNHMKFIDLFSGIGGFRSALELNGLKGTAYAEIDKYARQSYRAIYDTTDETEYTDITAVSDEEWQSYRGSVDFVVGGSPCFKAGTLITTSNGLKPIEQIDIDDDVLTHKGRYRKVITPMVNHADDYYEIITKGGLSTFVTGNHPMYVFDFSDVSNFEPRWVNVEDLNPKVHYIVNGHTTDEDGTMSRDNNNINSVWTYVRKHFVSEILTVDRIHEPSTVYNFEVDEDNSYVANGLVAHNCQSFSNAGHRRGFEDTRGTLFFNYINTVKQVNPKYFLYENVKGMLSHDKGETIKTIIEAFDEIGYYIDFDIFNSKHYGVPQQRERLYVVGVRKDVVDPLSKKPKDKGQLNIFDFVSDNTEHDEKTYVLKNPKGSRTIDKIKRWAVDKGVNMVNLLPSNDSDEVTARLVDVLEPVVDEKFYISKERTDKLLDNEKLQDLLQHYRTSEPRINVLGNLSATSYNAHNVLSEYGLSPTLAARDYKGPKNVLVTDKAHQIGNIVENHADTFGGNPQRGRIYSFFGLCPTVMATANDTIPKILMPFMSPNRLNKSQRGNRFKPNGREMFTLTSADRHGVIIDNTTGYNDGLRVYENQSPTIRSERHGLMTIEMKNDVERLSQQAKETFESGHCEHGDMLLPYNRMINRTGVAPTLTTRPEGLKTAILPVVRNPLKGMTPYGWHFEQNVYDIMGISRTVKANGGSGNIPKAIVGSMQKNAFIGHANISPSLTNAMGSGGGHIPMLCYLYHDIKALSKTNNHSLRIRKLIPLECWRLQGFTDEQFYKAKNDGVSNSQLYKQAGNSVTVNVVDAIVRHVLDKYEV